MSAVAIAPGPARALASTTRKSASAAADSSDTERSEVLSRDPSASQGPRIR